MGVGVSVSVSVSVLGGLMMHEHTQLFEICNPEPNCSGFVIPNLVMARALIQLFGICNPEPEPSHGMSLKLVPAPEKHLFKPNTCVLGVLRAFFVCTVVYFFNHQEHKGLTQRSRCFFILGVLRAFFVCTVVKKK